MQIFSSRVLQSRFDDECFMHAITPQVNCFPWAPKSYGWDCEPTGEPRFEDKIPLWYEDFKVKFIKHLDFPDQSLITKKSSMQYILEQHGGKMSTGMLCQVLKKSTFLSPEGFIIGEGLQKIAMNANRYSAFRFCPIAQNDREMRNKLLEKRFSCIYDLCKPVLWAASAEIARTYPIQLTWCLDIAVSSHVLERHWADGFLGIDMLSAFAVDALVRFWLCNPDKVYEHSTMVTPPRVTPTGDIIGVSDKIVRNGLRRLRAVLRDTALSRELSSGDRLEIRHEVGELLGTRVYLGAEIRSWCNKLAVLSVNGDSINGLPLVDGSAVPLVYTVEMARASFERGATAIAMSTERRPRRGDTILRMLHDAKRADLCTTVIPLIAQYVLTPTPRRFRPSWGQ